MRKRTPGRRGFMFSGAILFFVVIALIIQIGILAYDFIISKTDDNGLIAILMLVVIIILSSLCTIADILRRKIMVDDPVDKILAATERIATGDFSVRINIEHTYDKYNEYDLIFENLNTMAAELGKSEMLKTDFISNVSHELKTPLSIIQNYATVLQNKELDADTREKYAHTILSASKRLTNLVTNILKLNKLENQKIKPDYDSFNLSDLLAEAVLGYEEIIEAKKLNIECDLDDVIVTSSPSYLEIVWNNLISNAIKFTEPEGTVSVSLKKQGSNAVVKISDTGCGISPDTGKHIFEKFYQGDTSHSGEGNGLGLALVKKVIDILGGDISVSSELGKGTSFTIVLKGMAHE